MIRGKEKKGRRRTKKKDLREKEREREKRNNTITMTRERSEEERKQEGDICQSNSSDLFRPPFFLVSICSGITYLDMLSFFVSTALMLSRKQHSRSGSGLLRRCEALVLVSSPSCSVLCVYPDPTPSTIFNFQALSMKRTKNVEFFTSSESLVREARGGRITCCKSGKVVYWIPSISNPAYLIDHRAKKKGEGTH